MQIIWELSGSKWKTSLLLDPNIDPLEAATLCLERALADNEEIELGIVLILKNSLMRSDGESLLLLTSTILANAGFYSLSRELEEELQKVLHGNS